jgi:hypothetical protein
VLLNRMIEVRQAIGDGLGALYRGRRNRAGFGYSVRGNGPRLGTQPFLLGSSWVIRVMQTHGFSLCFHV